MALKCLLPFGKDGTFPFLPTHVICRHQVTRWGKDFRVTASFCNKCDCGKWCPLSLVPSAWVLHLSWENELWAWRTHATQQGSLTHFNFVAFVCLLCMCLYSYAVQVCESMLTCVCTILWRPDVGQFGFFYWFLPLIWDRVTMNMEPSNLERLLIRNLRGWGRPSSVSPETEWEVHSITSDFWCGFWKSELRS